MIKNDELQRLNLHPGASASGQEREHNAWYAALSIPQRVRLTAAPYPLCDRVWRTWTRHQRQQMMQRMARLLPEVDLPRLLKRQRGWRIW